MNTNKRQMLVTTALPYANGSIHIGHLVEHIQSDIWVRFQRHHGHQCIFICGDDAHGTPIMISAEKQGITPEELIKAVHKDHLEDFINFNIEYDNFYTTHSEENTKLSQLIYTRLRDRGDIETRTIMQCFDTEKNMFLPDRYVKGECPRCSAKDQYGDNCEECGATYTPSELKNPTSVLSGTTPTEKESVHYFFKLENYHDMLHEWLQSGNLQQSVAKKLLEWFQDGLQQWDISRDAPYFGIEIPDAPGKYFYVWLDAPVGYMASFENLCKQRDDLNFNDYWSVDSDKELYHFIGKDIIYFHALFWPAMLEGSGFRKPTNIFAHGFLTVNGKKMSKSRGTFITAKKYLEHLDPELLRYYYAAKLNSHIDDIDFNLDDFINRVNSDLIGKLINIASRCAGFITKKHGGMLAKNLDNDKLYQTFINKSEHISELFETRSYNQAIREIMLLADVANQYIAEKEPWALAKDESKQADVQNICTMGINLFRALVIFLKPVTPTLAKKTEQFLNIEPLVWNDINQPLLGHKIEKFKPMMQRIDKDTVKKLTE